MSIAKKATSSKSKSLKDEQNDDFKTSSLDSGVCNVAYDSMDGKVEEVISNCRLFAESMMKKRKEKTKVIVQICSIC